MWTFGQHKSNVWVTAIGHLGTNVDTFWATKMNRMCLNWIDSFVFSLILPLVFLNFLSTDTLATVMVF